MRWRKDVNETMRINFENEYYDILLIQEIGRRRGLKLTIRKKDNARH
jgi:head-tail adaptor